MKTYLYRRGDGNDGNYPRFRVKLAETDCPDKALIALVASDYIPGSRTRKHILRNLQAEDGQAWAYEGPKGEQVFGQSWLTAELQPDEGDAPSLKDCLDKAAWRFYKKETA